MKRASSFSMLLVAFVMALGLSGTPRVASAAPNVQACLDGCARGLLIDMAACAIGCGISGPGYVLCYGVCSAAALAHDLNCSYGCKHPNGIPAPTGWNPSSEDVAYPYHAGDVFTVNFGRLIDGTKCDFELGQGSVTEANLYLMDLSAIPPGGFPEETPFDNLPWISLGAGTFDGDRFWTKSINMGLFPPSQQGYVLRCDFAVPSDTAMYHGFVALPKIQEPITVTGDITADNTAMVFTAASEQPGMTVNSYPASVCWSSVVPLTFSTLDRYIYIAAWSDDNTGQGLLHDFSITKNGNTYPVYSGSPFWTVAPADSNLNACSGINQLSVAAAMANRIPTATFVSTTNGCFNPAIGQPTCYNIWGRVASISDTARWSWFDSGNQVSTDAPFKPGFNHRELLIFRLDTQDLTNTVNVDPGVMGNTMRLRSYPNPTLGSSRLEFTLAEESEANLSVYDVVGRKIATVTNGRLSAGLHNLTWDGRNSNGARVGPGTYFVKLQAGGQRLTSSVLILQ